MNIRAWINERRLKRARKKALKMSVLRGGKKYWIIQFRGKPRLFTKEKIELFIRSGIFKKMNMVDYDKISLFVTPKLQDNVYYKRGL